MANATSFESNCPSFSMKEIVVDIGCGGKNNLNLYGFSGEPTIALDQSKNFLERRRDGSFSGNLAEGDAENLPLKTASADQVFATHVLEHVNELDSTLEEIDRILRPGGKITIAVPHPRFESIMEKLDEEYHSSKMHQRVIRPKEALELLEARDYEIIHYETRGFTAALRITFSYLLHLKLLRNRSMEPQSGLLVKQDGQHANHASMNKVRRRLFSFSAVKIIDKFFPFETVVQAVKNK